MPESCRASIEERDHDHDTYGDVEWCEMSIVEHHRMKTALLFGYEGRLQEYLEDKYNDPDLYPQYAFLFPDKNGGSLSLMAMYWGATLSKEYCDLIEQEAATLASIILG